MIFPTTFILALILTHVAHAVPEPCHDPVPPKPPTRYPYEGQEFHLQIPSPLRTTSDSSFDNREGSFANVACSDGENGLGHIFQNFGALPNFPNIGGAFDVSFNSPNCGGCWLITNKANGATISLTAIDAASDGFNIAESAFRRLNGGELGDTLEVVATKVTPGSCLGGHE
jgi:hypothetical protein